MSEMFNILSGVCIGSVLGLIIGVWMAKYTGLSPSSRELKRALIENEEHSKTMQSRLKRRIAEFEQPPELQQMVQGLDLNSPDAVNMLINNLGSIKGIPRWIRPFIPGIAGYVKEHPEQVKGILERFITPHKGEELGDSL